MEPTVHVVDDDATSRWLITQMLDGIGARVRAYASPEEFLDGYSPIPRECLVTDLRMPGMSGLELQRRLADRGVTIPIIFISAYPEVPSAVAAVKGGAIDFLEKPVNAGTLLERVQSALKTSAELFADKLRDQTRTARLSLLTEREQEIARLVAEGKTSKEIGEQLSISPRTVENHRARVMEKLHVGSAVELARLLG